MFKHIWDFVSRWIPLGESWASTWDRIIEWWSDPENKWPRSLLAIIMLSWSYIASGINGIGQFGWGMYFIVGLFMVFPTVAAAASVAWLWRLLKGTKTYPVLDQRKAIAETSPKLDAHVEFSLVGDWDTPFSHQKFEGNQYAEAVWLRIKALKRLSSAKVKCRVVQNGKCLSSFFLSPEEFGGEVPSGFPYGIWVFSRHFVWHSTHIPSLDGGGQDLVTFRQEAGAWLFKGRDYEMALKAGHTYSVGIEVFHGDGPEERASFTVSLGDFRTASTVQGLHNMQRIHGRAE